MITHTHTLLSHCDITNNSKNNICVFTLVCALYSKYSVYMDTYFTPFSATLSPVSLWLCSCTAACIIEALLLCTFMSVCVCLCLCGCLCVCETEGDCKGTYPCISWPLCQPPASCHCQLVTHTYSRNIRWPSHSPDVCYSALQGSSDDVFGLSCGILRLQAKHGLTFRTEIYFWLKRGRSNAKLPWAQRLYMCTPKCLRLNWVW